MKLIIAIIQPDRLEAVKTALASVEVFRLTVMDVQGFGRQKGHTEVYRGHEFTVALLRKVQLMIAVNEEFLEPTIDAILKGGADAALAASIFHYGEYTIQETKRIMQQRGAVDVHA